jgi:hypothetical protein
MERDDLAKEATFMGLLGARRRGSTQDTSSTRVLQRGRSSEACETGGRVETGHDLQVGTRRAIPADPYAVWVAKREAEDEASRLRTLCAHNPREAWDKLKGWEPPPDAGTWAIVGR